MHHARTVVSHLRGALSAARRRISGDGGVTLIEVVVASVLLGVLASAVLGVILQTQSAQIGNRARVAAANLASREIDLVREQFGASDAGPIALADAGAVTNPHPLDGGTAGDPLVIDGTPYTVVRSAAWNFTGTGDSACDGGTLVAYPAMSVSVSVTWPNMGNIQPVVSSSILAPEKGNGIPATSSFVAVSVLDSNGDPSSGRSVRVANGGDIRPGVTDASGCATVRVDPAPDPGTEYTVSLIDAGYVDISGNPSPTKVTGLVPRGKLNNTVSFAYDQAGTVRMTLRDPGGGALTDPEVAGAQATLVAAEYSGTSGSTVHTLTGVTTTVTGLWPTNYGGFFGTVAPAGGYTTQELPPGGTIDLDVPFARAEVTITNLPAGTTGIVAVPAGTGTSCSSPGAKTFAATAPSGAIGVLPGNWDLFLTGTFFACSPGEVAQTLDSGWNSDIVWSSATTLRVNNARPGVLWAIDRALTGTLTTCPTGGVTGLAQNIDGARTGPNPIVAGDWYLYVTDGAANGTCGGFMETYNPKTVLYGVPNTVTWPIHTALLSITSIENVSGSSMSRRPYVYLTTTQTLTCTSTNILPSGGGTVTPLGRAGAVDGSINNITVAEGTWYVYGNDQNSSPTWNPRCRLAGTVVVGPSTTSLSINYRTTAPIPSVGP